VQTSEAANIFPIFFGTWIVLGLSSFAFFHFSKDAALKRKVLPVMSVSTGILFLGFIWLMGVRGEAMYLAVPAVILISLMNLRVTKFCDSCGRTLFNQNPFSKTEFCPKCGSKLP
jgi:hypothetical protein